MRTVHGTPGDTAWRPLTGLRNRTEAPGTACALTVRQKGKEGHQETPPFCPPFPLPKSLLATSVLSSACEWIHCSVMQGGDYSPSEQPEDTAPSPAEHMGSRQPFRKLRGPRRARMCGVWGKTAGPPGEGTEMPAHPESIEAVTGEMRATRGWHRA